LTYFNYLKSYFREESEIYIRDFSNLPLRYKLRLPYYLLLPCAIAICIATFLNRSLQQILPVSLSLTLLLVYLTFGIIPSIRDLTKKGASVPYIIKSYFLYNIPYGIAFAYGTLVKMIKKAVMRRAKS